MVSLAFAFRRLSSAFVTIDTGIGSRVMARQLVSKHQRFASSSNLPHESQNCPCFFCNSTKTKNGDDDGIRAHHILDRDKKQPVFTGIVEHPDGTHIKLDDPSSLDISRHAPGHVMEDWEIALEFASYFDLNGYDQLRQEVDFPPIRTNVKLVNFANHPDYYENQKILGAFSDEDFDEVYPFPNKLEHPYENPLDPMFPNRIRSGDAVMCISRPRRTPDNDMAFWATVMSVTSTGIIIAENKAHVPNVRPNPLEKYDWLQFLITNVMGMRKGPNWQGTHGKGRQRGKSNQEIQ